MQMSDYMNLINMQRMGGMPQGQSQAQMMPNMQVGEMPVDDSIIDRGAIEAAKVMRNSIGVDPAQEDHLRQLMLLKIFNNLAKPGYGDGLSGTLRAFNAGAEPAIKEYLEGKQSAKKTNTEDYMKILEYKRELKKLEAEQKKLAKEEARLEREYKDKLAKGERDEKYRYETLGETKRKHNLEETRLEQEYKRKLEQEKRDEKYRYEALGETRRGHDVKEAEEARRRHGRWFSGWRSPIPTKLEKVGPDLSNMEEVMQAVKQASPEEILARSQQLQKGID